MEDIIDIIVTETTNTIEITAQPNDEIIDVNIIDNREDIVLNVTPTVVEININSLTSNFGVEWGDITGTLADQTDLNNALALKANLVGGKVPASELPSYVDDVVEVANFAALPATGETGKIYITLDNNKIYRWSGSVYVEIADSTAVWGAITGTLSSQTDLQNALNAKFDDPTGDTTQYIAGDGSLITFPVAGQAGTLVREVRNTTGATLTKGTIVYISGATGNKPTVSKALATGDSTSAQTFGMCQANIANNSNGYVVCVGDLGGLDTSGLTEGNQLYLSSTTAGTYTTTKQLAPAHLVYIGVVTRAHPTLGQIEVKIQNGYELNEIHDVAISSLANNDGLFYESATDLWKNKSIATVLGYTPANGANYLPLTGGTLSGQLNIDSALRIKSGSVTGILLETYSTNELRIRVTPVSTTFDMNLVFPSASRTFTFPNATGTLALTSDLASYLPLAGGTLTGALIGTSGAFSGNLGAGVSSFANWGGGTQNVLQVKSASIYEFGGNETALSVNAFYDGAWKYINNGIASTLQMANGLFNFRRAVSGTAGNVISWITPFTVTSAGAGTFTSSVTATSLIRLGGTSSQFLKADGSVDSSTYALDSAVVKLTGNQTIAGIKTFSDGTYHEYGLLLKHGTSTNAPGYTGIAGTSSGIKIGVGTPFHSNLVFSTSAIYTYTFPSVTGTLALTSDLSTYLPLSGGTLTGALSGTSATFSGQATIKGSVNEQLIVDYTTASGGFTWQSFRINGSNKYRFFGHTDNSFALYSDSASAQVLTFASTGAATFSSSITAGGRYFASASVADNIIEVINTDTTNGYGLFVRAGGTAANRYVARFKNAADSDVMWIDKGGNVGIGTTAPGEKLQVEGITKSGIAYRAGTYTAGSTTPSVSGISFLNISNSSATTITNFTGGVDGQIITLYFNDSNTTITRNNAYLSLGLNFTSTAYDILTLISFNGLWYEVSRSINA
jgi:hypothetical protein